MADKKTSASDILKLIKDKDVKYVDVRFTDPRGKWQHVTFDLSMVDDDFLNHGTMFDGSSIAGWKAINESDMLLLPDLDTAVIDPFFAQTTLILICDVLEPMTGQRYGRDPRSIAKAAEAYVNSSGVGDTTYFGPEAEFFVFDDVRFDVSMNKCFYFPLNPVGRVFGRSELALLAAAVSKSGAVVISDEVYEHLTFDGYEHVPLATLPGMQGRVVRIGSAGKIFSLTGWKVGWVMGPKPMIEVIGKAHQFLIFTTAPALQLGIAHGLTHEMEFAAALRTRLQANRDLLAAGLGEIGFEVLPSEGTYFLTAGIAGLTNEKDRAFCERLVREAGVALIPLSVFFSGGTPDTYVRFAFCKQRALVEEALARLKRYFAS